MKIGGEAEFLIIDKGITSFAEKNTKECANFNGMGIVYLTDTMVSIFAQK